MDLSFMGDLGFKGALSFWIAVIISVDVILHYKFYLKMALNKGLREDVRRHAFRLSLVVLGVLFLFLSIASYGANWIIKDGGLEWREFLKEFQIVTMLAFWFALHWLKAFYKDGLFSKLIGLIKSLYKGIR